MTKKTLNLAVYPHPLLKKKLNEVREFDDQLHLNIQEMFRIMYENKGIGLAGNQAGLDQRIIVMNLTGDQELKDQEMVFINPEIQRESKETILDEEGCLSFPGVKIDVTRHQSLTFSALDEAGQKLVYEADDLFARCLQHEMDHINGITFIERLSPTQRAQVSEQIKELEQQHNNRG